MTWIIGIIGTIGGWIFRLIFGNRREKQLEKEVVEKTAENIELRSEIAGKKVEAEILKETEQFDDEWKDAKEKGDKKKLYDLLRDDFRRRYPD